MEKGRSFETIVGTLVLLVAIFFFHYVYSRSSWKGMDGYYLIAKFDRADGLAEGIDVKISGVRVGKVASLELDPSSFFAVVKFYVSEKVKLPNDSSANVASEGLFGGKYLSITPGGSKEFFNPGDEIEDTSGPLDLESLLGKFIFSSSEK
ncbi:MAG: outer membrane lipid asymmetry maintenance protein MlaD [Holosporaceae bacterium]|jgi:phospholipid/cholesterol/gamma-HCH transport system substrate-binding protein|nr:outer membrane lipid asymmetry maintenance protein MlaD [Holosporaceae bacterium]